MKVEMYPLPKTEAMLSTYDGDFHFAKIDLNQTYFELPVDEKFQELLAINT